MDKALADTATASKFVRSIADVCPHIEEMTGYQACIPGVNIAECKELWRVDLATWRHFCERCTRLTQFDWLCVPFATRYFELFGEQLKPQLRSLAITSAHNWRWNAFLQQASASDRTSLETNGYAGAAVNAHAMLRGCPALQQLTIEWYVSPQHGTHLSRASSKMNPEIFGDDFCEALATLCPDLTTLTYRHVRDRTRPSCVLLTFTDHSLRALARLAWLTCVRLVHVNVTGAGLFVLVATHAFETRAPREYEIILSSAATATAFYTTLPVFLEHLVACGDEELRFASRPVALQLVADRVQMEKEWSVTYLSTLQKLIVQIQTRCPSLHLRVLLEDSNGTDFTSILEFQMTTRPATDTEPLKWSRRHYTPGVIDTQVDDVFTSRLYPALAIHNHDDDGGEDVDEDVDEDEEDQDEFDGEMTW